MEKIVRPKIDKKTQYKLIVFGLINFLLGVITLAVPQIIDDSIKAGLYHKIIPLGLFNFPIGMFSIALITALLTAEIIMCLRLDYNILVYGLDTFKMKSDK